MSGTGLWDSRLHNAPANTSTCKCRVTMTALLHSWQFISASCQESGVCREYRARCLIWTQVLKSGPISYLQSLFPIRAHAPASEPSGWHPCCCMQGRADDSTGSCHLQGHISGIPACVPGEKGSVQPLAQLINLLMAPAWRENLYLLLQRPRKLPTPACPLSFCPAWELPVRTNARSQSWSETAKVVETQLSGGGHIVPPGGHHNRIYRTEFLGGNLQGQLYI